MAKKVSLEKKKEVSSVSAPSSASATPLRVSENPFVSQTKMETAKNPFVATETNEDEEVGSSAADSTEQMQMPEAQVPSLVSKAKAKQEQIAPQEEAEVGSMVAPSATKKKKR